MAANAPVAMVASMLVAVTLVTGCAQKYQKVEESLQQPINCSAAREDIQTLQNAKVSKTEEATAGLSYALPTTIFVGILTGTGGAKYDVGTGEFNRKIDERIAEIREQCKVY
ncbi:MAG TPA: hypothetical protein VMI34_11910 [Candidatus Bathyarchaeia archaeon]|nr:hypothetical protein [Candidatus Bathyarchaeia archaeon]